MDTSFAPPADEIRARIHGMWATVAPAWKEHAAYADTRGAALTERMLALAAVAPGDRVLELACGPGGLGIAAAGLVAPGGEVVLSDVVPEMVAVAAERARERGVGNATARVLDLERIEEPDASFDVVLCREGLMFAIDPARAAAEIRRVLRPNGRVAIAVWGPREQNPWLGILFDAVSAHLGKQIPPPGMPGPFSLSDAGHLAAVLAGAGLADVAVGDLDFPTRAPSFDEWWARTCALAGPVAGILASLPQESAWALRERVAQAAAAYETPAGLEFPGLTLVATGRR
jgi:ubiquinone/menaquinone biosynthesis C-methylase UbiE